LLQNKNKKQINDILFEKLPRYENFTSETQKDKAVHEYLMNDDVNLESVFWNSSNQRSLISPLMEDEEGLVINSIVVAPNTNKFNVFIEDTIIRKIA